MDVTAMVFFELFAHNPTLIQVPAGRPLFVEGEAGQVMYVLTTGRAEIRMANQVLEKLAHGSIVGELGLVSPGPRLITVMASCDCEFVAIDEQRFQLLIQQTPIFAIQVMRVMAERLQRAGQWSLAPSPS